MNESCSRKAKSEAQIFNCVPPPFLRIWSRINCNKANLTGHLIYKHKRLPMVSIHNRARHRTYDKVQAHKCSL